MVSVYNFSIVLGYKASISFDEEGEALWLGDECLLLTNNEDYRLKNGELFSIFRIYRNDDEDFCVLGIELPQDMTEDAYGKNISLAANEQIEMFLEYYSEGEKWFDHEGQPLKPSVFLIKKD